MHLCQSNPKASEGRCIKAEQGLEPSMEKWNAYKQDLSPFLRTLLASHPRSVSLSMRRLYEV